MPRTQLRFISSLWTFHIVSAYVRKQSIQEWAGMIKNVLSEEKNKYMRLSTGVSLTYTRCREMQCLSIQLPYRGYSTPPWTPAASPRRSPPTSRRLSPFSLGLSSVAIRYIDVSCFRLVIVLILLAPASTSVSLSF